MASVSLRPRRVAFAKVWSSLEDSVTKLITLRKLDRKTWDDNFYDIYQLCVALPEPLSDHLYMETKNCLEHHVEQLHEEVSGLSGPDLLLAYHKYWTIFYEGSKYIHNLYGYLNKQHIKRQKYTDADLTYGGLSVDQIRNSMLEIGELALDIWRRKMVHPLETNLVSQILSGISGDRKDHTIIPHSVVQGVILSFVEVEEYRTRNQLELYQTVFEAKFLDASSDHYKSEASRLLVECNCSQYMEKVLLKIDEENLRSRKFLHASSYEKVTKMCQDTMVAAHQERLHSVSRDIVQENKTHDLQNMYTLLKPIPQGLTVLIREFQNHAQKLAVEGVQSLKGENIPQQFVDNILSVYNKFSEMVRTVFQNDQEFLKAMDKALLVAVNHKEESKSVPKASEWLAKYTDFLLRRSVKGMSESDVEDKLTMAIVIFRYIEDKDIFQKFYSRMLAQRLIHGLSVSMDAEESMINKLKQACGYEFTSKLQRMFTDIGLSKELTEKFHGFLEAQGKRLEAQMQIQVLQAGAWPLSAAMPVLAVPEELQPSIKLFEDFYSRNYSGRKLSWLYNLATAEVKMSDLDKPYQVTMSVQQMAVVLSFNEKLEWGLTELQNITQLTTDVLTKIIRSVVDAGILKCSDKDITEGAVLTVNPDFTSKRLRFKILTPIIQKQAEKETEQVNTTVQQDRKYFLECTIVRIMKTRKVLKHNSLIQEVINQSKARFTPDVAFIKKIIESLIEKQYLQRTENNDEYAYLA